ncbi:MAG: pantoate--beta-alanine ligase [Bdellovibrionaceae bacterium]|nr:pantoate--beta-alanine ligase [Pseudobdellovibrionaceae bacterium]MDW8191133.1 pantoate--beta-alanine ligase [Pseudobdellovibrionaceae bacterium]
MIIIEQPKELARLANDLTQRGVTIGLVPTMGALHAGHASLMERARKENDRVILTIFVNPTQFNQKEDLLRYPRTPKEDLALAQSLGVDVVFMPQNPEDMYPDEYRYQVTEHSFSHLLCGAYRPGHFTGVLTIVLKLFMLSRCQRAYFGEKDYQQLELIRGMVDAFFLPVTIVACPTVREHSGLALSSRNSRLSEEGRRKAALLYQKLRVPHGVEQIRKELENSGFQVDYVTELKGRRFVAAWIEGVRLIDNIPWPDATQEKG